MENGPIEDAKTSNLNHLKGVLLFKKNNNNKNNKNAPIVYINFAENVTLLSLNIIKLIPLGASTSKYKKYNYTNTPLKISLNLRYYPALVRGRCKPAESSAIICKICFLYEGAEEEIQARYVRIPWMFLRGS